MPLFKSRPAKVGAAAEPKSSGARRPTPPKRRSESVGSGSEYSDSGSGSEYSGSGSSHDGADEGAADYCVGGYHPVKILDSFGPGARYTVARKLGWGHFSVVWLVHDAVGGCSRALKIQKSARKYTDAARDEVRILSDLTRHDDQPGIVGLHDSFMHGGPHGRHVCMVFELMGQSLLGLIKHFDYKGIGKGPLAVIGSQCVQGIAYMHECGYVHTDIKPENVLISLSAEEYAAVHASAATYIAAGDAAASCPLPSGSREYAQWPPERFVVKVRQLPKPAFPFSIQRRAQSTNPDLRYPFWHRSKLLRSAL